MDGIQPLGVYGAKEKPMLLLVGGLSGAGKSTLGKYLKAHCAFHWVELDDPQDQDMFDKFQIHDQWRDFCNGNPAPLRAHFPSNTVLTVDSTKIIRAPMYLNCDEVRIRYLWGPKEKCFDRAHERNPKLVTREHWDRFNKEIFEYLNSANCPPGWKIEVFDEPGRPLSSEKLADAVLT